MSEPGAAETVRFGCPDCSLETDLLRTNRAGKGRAERSKEKVLQKEAQFRPQEMQGGRTGDLESQLETLCPRLHSLPWRRT